jgi:predicted signal transduction protein with EAL and GGDEF domain
MGRLIRLIDSAPAASDHLRPRASRRRAWTLVETLAEGIEDPGQLQALRRQRCDQGQGFLFAHPLEPVAFEQFLTDHRRQDLAS